MSEDNFDVKEDLLNILQQEEKGAILEDDSEVVKKIQTRKLKMVRTPKTVPKKNAKQDIESFKVDFTKLINKISSSIDEMDYKVGELKVVKNKEPVIEELVKIHAQLKSSRNELRGFYNTTTTLLSSAL